MSQQHLLVVSNSMNQRLQQTFGDGALSTVAAVSHVEAVQRLARQPFAAVVVCHENNTVDALETVLNVRDMDLDVPIVALIWSLDRGGLAILRDQPGITLATTLAHARSAVMAIVRRTSLTVREGRNPAHEYAEGSTSQAVGSELGARADQDAGAVGSVLRVD